MCQMYDSIKVTLMHTKNYADTLSSTYASDKKKENYIKLLIS